MVLTIDIKINNDSLDYASYIDFKRNGPWQVFLSDDFFGDAISEIQKLKSLEKALRDAVESVARERGLNLHRTFPENPTM